jgi:acetyl esterase/lipase
MIGLVALLMALTAAAFSATPVARDVPYGNDPLQRFDVYAPPNVYHAPVIFMVHGGGWRRGDKAMSRMVDNKVAYWVSRGYVFISVNYRLNAGALAEAKDVAHALSVVQQRAGEWGGDGSKVIVMGHSAGAHLVALVAVTTTAPVIGSVILDSGALDVPQIMQSRHLPFYDDAFGSDPASMACGVAVSPRDEEDRAVLVVCSSRRRTSCSQSHAFVNRLTNLGTRASVLEENLSHREINEQLGEPSRYTAAVDAFLTSLSPRRPRSRT